jgi:hypothetical protein
VVRSSCSPGSSWKLAERHADGGALLLLQQQLDALRAQLAQALTGQASSSASTSDR